jgi:peptide/nickel transport system permease protein
VTAPASLAVGVPGDRAVSYWAVVGAQLRKNRVAMLAWRLLQALLLSAIAAPLIAFNVPIAHLPGGEAPRLPLLSNLFDRTLFETSVDVLFNLALLALPVWLAEAALLRRLRAEGAAAFRRPMAWALAALLGLFLLVEAWATVQGRASSWIAFAGVVVPGAVILALPTSRASGDRRLRPWAARLLLVGLFVAGLLAVLLRAPETRPSKIWRGTGATQTGAMVFPPIPFHPTGVGDPDVLPRVYKKPDARNLLGCDKNGYDVLARILFGTRISLTIGLVGVSIYVLIGTVFGSLAGYYGGKVDLLVSRLLEVMICFPTLFLLLTIIAVFESRSIFLIMAAIGLVGWPGVARLVRGEFLRQRNLDYVTAAVAQGLRQRRVIFRHVLPNCLGPVLVSASFGIAGAILTESGLAFLGLGDSNAVSWGLMLTDGRTSQLWHLILVPGFAIFFVVTVFNLLGDGLRDALDPKLRR